MPDRAIDRTKLLSQSHVDPKDVDRRRRHIESLLPDVPRVTFDPHGGRNLWRVSIYQAGERRHRRVNTLKEGIELRQHWELQLGHARRSDRSYRKRPVVLWV